MSSVLSRHLLLCALVLSLLVALGLPVTAAEVVRQQEVLLDPEGREGDFFGGAVAATEHRLVVGAPEKSAAGTPASETNPVGSVSVFTPATGGSFTRVELRPSDGSFRDGFGRSVATAGDLVAVGAVGAATRFPDGGYGHDGRGAAYVFTDEPRGMSETRLRPSESVPFASFGESVATDGRSVVVGAPGTAAASGELSTGAVHVFEQTADGWREQRITPAAPRYYGAFGAAVAMVGERIVVGAPRGEEGASGSVHVLAPDGHGGYDEVQVLNPDPAHPTVNFGSTLAVDGGRLVVGAPGRPSGRGDVPGSVHVFDADAQGAYTQTARLVTDDPSLLAVDLGASVAVRGDRVATSVIPFGGDVGTVLVFDLGAPAGPRVRKAYVPPSPLPFRVGHALTFAGDRIVAGGPMSDPGTGRHQGAVHLLVEHEGADVSRTAAANRYDTSALVAEEFTPGVPLAVVATGASFPDALAGAALAGSKGGPVVLTRPDSLSSPARDTLVRLRPTRVLVTGGPGAVSDRVLESIRTATGAQVARVAGGDRYATAAAIARQFPVGVDVAYVTTGSDFPDALAGSARAGAQDAPVLLTRQAGLPASTRDALGRLRPRRIVVLGGPGAVAPAVADQLRQLAPVVERLSGSDRYTTAVRLSAPSRPGTPVVYLATGANFPDALSGAARAGAVGAPLLLTRTGALPAAVRNELVRLRPERIVVLGGEGAVSADVEKELYGLVYP